MDIIVTTPKFQIANAAQEAADCIADGGGDYFRRFTPPGPDINIGERVFYVEDGFVRGFAVVSRVANIPRTMQCDTTGRWYAPGFYIFMPANSWRWIRPIVMCGFQNYRYIQPQLNQCEIVGNWLDKRPSVSAATIVR